jgi:hypothetical protein
MMFLFDLSKSRSIILILLFCLMSVYKVLFVAHLTLCIFCIFAHLCDVTTLFPLDLAIRAKTQMQEVIWRREVLLSAVQ